MSAGEGGGMLGAPDPAIESAAVLHHLLLSFGSDVTSEWKAGGVRYFRAPEGAEELRTSREGAEAPGPRSGRDGARDARAGTLFAIVKPLASRVDLGFRKLGRARNKRILAAKGRLPFLPHLVEIEAPGDIDSEVRAWLRESYEMAAETS